MIGVKSVVGRTVLLGCLVASLFFFVGAVPARSAEPIRIGVVLSITGSTGFVGTMERDGIIAIVDDVNRKGGVLGRPLEVFLEDDQSNPTTSVIAATKLVKDKKVCMIVGPSMTDAGMAIIPVCEQEQVPFIITAPVVSPFKKWSFIIGSGDQRDAANFLKQTIQKFGAKRIALIHDTSNYGSTGARVFNAEIGKYPGSSIVIQEKHELADTNMIPQLTKIKAANPDTLVVYTNGPPAAVIAKNFKQLGMKMRVLCAGGVAVPEFIKIAGPIAEEYKWLYWELKAAVAGKFSPDDPYRKNLYEPFKKVLQAKFGPSADVVLFHTLGHDGIKVAVEALKVAGTDDRAALRNALEKVKWEGFVGPFACSPTDHIGAVAATRTFLILKNGELQPYEK